MSQVGQGVYLAGTPRALRPSAGSQNSSLNSRCSRNVCHPELRRERPQEAQLRTSQEGRSAGGVGRV